MERTLILLKPDAVQRGLCGSIIARFERKGLKILGMKLMKITPELAAQHYEAHREKKFELFPYCNQCDQLIPHADALVYTNRHKLPKEVAVQMSNTDLYNLVEDKAFDAQDFSERYADGLVNSDRGAE